MGAPGLHRVCDGGRISPFLLPFVGSASISGCFMSCTIIQCCCPVQFGLWDGNRSASYQSCFALSWEWHTHN